MTPTPLHYRGRNGTEIREVTLDNLYTHNARIHQLYQSDTPTIICPLGALPPSALEMRWLLTRRRYSARVFVGYDSGQLVMVWLFVDGLMRGCWGRTDDPFGIDQAQWDLAEALASEGGVWRLETGRPGHVSRRWFQDNFADEGPWSWTVPQPGLDGLTYSHLDDVEWWLEIYPDGTWLAGLV